MAYAGPQGDSSCRPGFDLKEIPAKTSPPRMRQKTPNKAS